MFSHFTTDAEGEDSDIWTTCDSLSLQTPLIAHTGSQDDPDFSPDGRYLAYTSAQTISLRGGSAQVVRQIYVMDLSARRARLISDGGNQNLHPDWSPSGQEIAFSSDRSGQLEIWAVHGDGSGSRQITSGEGSKVWPAWSPNGQHIMFNLIRHGRQSLWIVDSDGRNSRPFEPFGNKPDLELRDADWR